MRNTVYDPMYEAMGLPIDPHIRMFIARRDNGKLYIQCALMLKFAINIFKIFFIF